MRDDTALREAIREAAACVREETHASPWSPFEEPVPADAMRSARGQHAVGIIEAPRSRSA